ncbi:hypothetical protein Tcan_00833, partial [Toxocara canis]
MRYGQMILPSPSQRNEDIFRHFTHYKSFEFGSTWTLSFCVRFAKLPNSFVRSQIQIQYSYNIHHNGLQLFVVFTRLCSSANNETKITSYEQSVNVCHSACNMTSYAIQVHRNLLSIASTDSLSLLQTIRAATMI